MKIFFVGEILVEYNDKIEDPVTLFDVSSRIINIDNPKLYNYRYVKIENDTPIFDWVVILMGPIMLALMLFTVFTVTGSTSATRHFEKDRIHFDADSLMLKVNERMAVDSFLKEVNIEDSIRRVLYNQDLKFAKALRNADKINLLSRGNFKTITNEDSYFGFLKSDTFILGDGYTVYYERKSIFEGLFLISILIIGFSLVFIFSYKNNKNRLLDIRLRRLYIKCKKTIA